RGSAERPLRAERFQGVHHARWRRRDLRGHGGDGPRCRYSGISSFILTKETTDLDRARELGLGHDDSLEPMPGFRSGKKEDKLGWRASDTRELIFDNVEVDFDVVEDE